MQNISHLLGTGYLHSALSLQSFILPPAAQSLFKRVQATPSRCKRQIQQGWSGLYNLRGSLWQVEVSLA